MSDTSEPRMSPASLIVHCLLERRDDQWQAFSLEFGLAAQADSDREAMQKLEDMVRSYVYDALVGEDREHASLLLARRAAARVFLKYYLVLAMSLLRRLGGRRNGAYPGTYERPLPLMPASCAA